MLVPKLRSPIVLVPGMFGFDQLRWGTWTVASYFAGLPDGLRAAGNRVLVARPHPTDGIARRAAQLKALLDRELPGEAVHLIAHSMGGLDSRYLISRLDMASRVLSLTTIATPHRGTPFADWGIERLERMLKPVFGWLRLPDAAFYDVTTAACRRFNEEVPNAPGVRYFSVAGRHEGGWRKPELMLPHRVILKAEGPNDGLVSVASASFGEATEVWDGDHVGVLRYGPNAPAQAYRRGRDYTANYIALVRRLADAGF